MAKNIVTFESYCEQRGWKPCGLSADWSVEAYAVRGSGPYGLIALDLEDGTYSIVYNVGNQTTVHFNGSFEGWVTFCEHIFGGSLYG